MTSEIAGRVLKSFIERIERLEEEKKNLTGDISQVYAEAKSGGFDVKVMREIVKRRKMDPDDLAEFDALLDLYESALTPIERHIRDSAA